MDNSIFEALAPSLSFVGTELFALKISRILSRGHERFVMWFLNFTDLDAEPGDTDPDNRPPKRPLMAKITLKTGSWSSLFLCASAAVFLWAAVMRGWFWVPPWFENSWSYIVLGCGVSCAFLTTLSVASLIAAKL